MCMFLQECFIFLVSLNYVKKSELSEILQNPTKFVAEFTSVQMLLNCTKTTIGYSSS